MENTIYIQGEKQKFESIDEFLDYYISRSSPATYWSDTYEIQCEANRNRSIDDLMLLVNHYFPDTEVKELIRALQRVGNSKKHKDKCVFILICPTISKPVVYREFVSTFNLSENPEYKGLFSSFLVNRTTSNSIYTYEQLIEMAE